MSTTSTHAVEPDVRDDAFPHHWRHAARAGFLVQVDWRRVDDGRGVEGRVRDLNCTGHHPFALHLDGDGKRRVVVLLVHVSPDGAERFIDVTLTLRESGDRITLVCNLPVSDHDYLDTAIDRWRPTRPPEPVPSTDAGDPPLIEAPPAAEDLYPFVWMRPLTPALQADAGLRFIPCPPAADLPLLQALEQAADPAAKIAAAQAFVDAGGLPTSLAALGPHVARMPDAHARLRALTGHCDREELIETLEDALRLPATSTLSRFLQGTEWTAAVPTLWQSVFAMALVGTAAEAALAGALVSALQVGHIAERLVAGGAPQPSLDDEGARRVALQARVVVPDAVCVRPAASGLRGGDEDASWEVAGIGELRAARHRLLGHARGELAEVVNVMPRERQERIERQFDVHDMREHEERQQDRDDTQGRSRALAGEIIDAMSDVMAAGAHLRNLSGITPSYGNLNLSLSGTASAGDAAAGSTQEEFARMAQRTLEQAVQRMGERIGRQRAQAWRTLREQRRSQTIDNAAHERLVGRYHWIDRVVEVSLEPQGERLVLAFRLAHPARAWIHDVEAAGPVPLLPVPGLPAPAAGLPPYTVVTADSALALGARYGVLDLEPAPPAQLTVVATVDRTTAGASAVLHVPDGYAVTAASAVLAVSDGRYALQCAIGGIETTGLAGTPPPALSVAAPACASPTSVGDASVTPAAVTAAMATVAIDGLSGRSGDVPVTVATGAPAFNVSVQLQCALAENASGTSPLYAGWQARTYARLDRAWRDAASRHADALAARIAQAMAGRPVETQRLALQRGCLQALLATPGDDAEHSGDALAWLAWQSMTWQYAPWPADAPGAWPEPIASQARPPDMADLRPFLSAASATVLVPAVPGGEAWLLWLLQAAVPWPGGPHDAPASAATVPLLERLAAGDAPSTPVPRWPVRIPTSLLYLDAGSDLPPLPLRATASRPASAGDCA